MCAPRARGSVAQAGAATSKGSGFAPGRNASARQPAARGAHLPVDGGRSPAYTRLVGCGLAALLLLSGLSPARAAELGSQELVADLQRMAGEIRAPMERLGRLRSGYGSLDDLAAVDEERDQLREELLERQQRFDEKLKAFKELKDSRRTAEFHLAVVASLMRSDPSLLREANTLVPLWKELRDFGSKVRSTLDEDRLAYEARKAAIARERARRLLLAAGVGLAVLLCGAASIGGIRRKFCA